MIKHPNLVFMAFPNMPSAMDAVHHLGGFLDILEFGSLINQSVSLLASCEENPLKSYTGTLTDSLFLEKVPPELLKAFFHQLNVKVENHLLVVEAKQFGALLTTCDQILKHTKFEIIDIQRNTGFGNTAYFANDGSSDITPYIPWDASFKLIPNPSAALLKFFN